MRLTIPLSLKFILPLILVLSLVTYALIPLAENMTLQWFMRDLDMRANVIASTMQEPLVQLINDKSHNKILSFFNRITKDERLFALGFCGTDQTLIYSTPTFPKVIECSHLTLNGTIVQLPERSLHVTGSPVTTARSKLGQLVVVHDMSFIEKRSSETKKYIFYLFAGLAVVISTLTAFIAQLSWRSWITSVRSLLKGEGLFKPPRIKNPALAPLAKDLQALVRDLESERLQRDEHQITWTPTALKAILRNDLAGDEILIVSNREPYIHNWCGTSIETQMPASGLVTALEPIMRACSGTWVAHGSGSADKEVVDKFDHVDVPPERPLYKIRRVWLTKEQENGYYYGFSNEGLWPLCHIAHTRPTFRAEDWEHYSAVNKKFADAVLKEVKTDDPVILIQDYHFALLPRMIRDKLPNATIITFWHIPWPNSEAFGICPWREEILEGLLGSSILGFHTRFHCNNFIDTVDRFLEARADRDSSTVSYGNKLTAVRNYPISIEWPVRWLENLPDVATCRASVRKTHSLPPDHLLAVGVDRLDYTKGILERFLSVERLLETEPDLIGKFSLIQIAAPSRSNIEQYQNFESEVRSLARKINSKYGRVAYNPILLLVEHHEPEQIYHYYRASEVCMVTSLHDGMNLVAKEYISARDDNQGVLILSQFTGAAKELPESLIVNPYNVDQCSMALSTALKMPAFEQLARMKSMRSLVQEYNVYRWAGRMLMDASRIRQRQRLQGRISKLNGTAVEGLNA